jgi:hypothetical protein
MSVLNQIAFYQNRRDEVPNQILAKKMVQESDAAGLKEIAEHLWDKNPNVQSDCLKTLYEVAYLKPELVAPYVKDFIKLTQAKNNRLVWGAMIALSSTAALNPSPCLQELDTLKQCILNGSVITQDNGIKVLAALSSLSPENGQQIFPFLLKHLQTCREKDVAQRSESVFPAVNSSNQADFISVVEARLPTLTDAQKKRVGKLLRSIQKK